MIQVWESPLLGGWVFGRPKIVSQKWVPFLTALAGSERRGREGLAKNHGNAIASQMK